MDAACLQSSYLTGKAYERYRVIYSDDASSDGTAELVKRYCIDNHLEKRIHLKQNKKRQGPLANIYEAIHSCKPHEIVVLLDGNDWLAHTYVLAYLNLVYQNQNVWITYGQFQFWPLKEKGWAGQIPSNIINANAYREYNFLATHLKTGYAALFQHIKRKDLLWKDTFYPMGGDLALQVGQLFP